IRNVNSHAAFSAHVYNGRIQNILLAVLVVGIVELIKNVLIPHLGFALDGSNLDLAAAFGLPYFLSPGAPFGPGNSEQKFLLSVMQALGFVEPALIKKFKDSATGLDSDMTLFALAKFHDRINAVYSFKGRFYVHYDTQYNVKSVSNGPPPREKRLSKIEL